MKQSQEAPEGYVPEPITQTVYPDDAADAEISPEPEPEITPEPEAKAEAEESTEPAPPPDTLEAIVRDMKQGS